MLQHMYIILSEIIFKKTGIETLGFGGSPINDEEGVPPNSPDMNAIERLFGEWGDKVNARNPQNVSELIRIAKDEWDKFTPEHIRKYIFTICIKFTLG